MRRDTTNYENCSALSKNEPPVADGIKKPMKKGGYSDSGADIAYCLKENGEDVIPPCENPDIYIYIMIMTGCFPTQKRG